MSGQSTSSMKLLTFPECSSLQQKSKLHLLKQSAFEINQFVEPLKVSHNDLITQYKHSSVF